MSFRVAVDLAQNFSTSPLEQIIACCNIVQGVTVLNNKLFVVAQHHSKKVKVYESRDNEFTSTRPMQVTEMKDPTGLASSDRHQCLYISDEARPYVVHRIDV